MDRKNGGVSRKGRMAVCLLPARGRVSGDAVRCCGDIVRACALSGDHLALSGQHVPEEQLKWLRKGVPLLQTAPQNLHGPDRGFGHLSEY